MNDHDTQRNQVLQMLDETEAVCGTTYLQYRIPRYGARIWDLRQGHGASMTRRTSLPA